MKKNILLLLAAFSVATMSEAQLIVKSNGGVHIPYLATIYTSDFIQNEVFEGDTYILSDNGVQVGRNVTTLKLNGPVVIDSGKTSVISPNGTTIKNSFEVRQGAEFVIKPILP